MLAKLLEVKNFKRMKKQTNEQKKKCRLTSTSTACELEFPTLPVTAATCGATLNVLMFPRMNITGYQVPTIPGTVMPVLLSGFQTLSFLIQPGTRLTIRPLQSLTPLSPMSLLTTRPVSRLTTSSTCRLLTKTSTVFKIKWTK